MDASSSHSKWDIQYHIVFIPKRRRNILGGCRANQLSAYIRKAAQEIECLVDTLNVQENHVHLLLRVPPKVSLSVAMQAIKSKSAQAMLNQFPELRAELPEGTFWARGFYANSVGGLDINQVRDYILNNQE